MRPEQDGLGSDPPVITKLLNHEVRVCSLSFSQHFPQGAIERVGRRLDVTHSSWPQSSWRHHRSPFIGDCFTDSTRDFGTSTPRCFILRLFSCSTTLSLGDNLFRVLVDWNKRDVLRDIACPHKSLQRLQHLRVQGAEAVAFRTHRNGGATAMRRRSDATSGFWTEPNG